MDNDFVDNFRDKDKVLSILRSIHNSPGKLTSSRMKREKEPWLESNIGSFASRIYSVPKKIESIDENDWISIGGSCLIKTHCLTQLKKGFVEDKVTGESTKYKNVEDVLDWLRNYGTIEQVMESSGLNIKGRYIFFSETYLWSRSVSRIIQRVLGIEISSDQFEKIFESLQKVSERLFKTFNTYAQQYSKIHEIYHVQDFQVWNELVTTRNVLLEQVHNHLVEEGDKENSILLERALQDDHKSDYSIIWITYTGAFYKILKEFLGIDYKFGIFSETWFHATGSEMKIKRLVSNYLFGTHPYLENGLNENVAFIPFDGFTDFYGNRSRSKNSISTVINFTNYSHILSTLTPEDNISPNDNNIYQWALYLKNLGKMEQYLLEWQLNFEIYKDKRSKLKHESRKEQKKLVNSLKKEFKDRFNLLQTQIIQEIQAIVYRLIQK